MQYSTYTVRVQVTREKDFAKSIVPISLMEGVPLKGDLRNADSKLYYFFNIKMMKGYEQ